MPVTLLDMTARAGHTWKTGDEAQDKRLVSLRSGFAHRARHWPQSENVEEADWQPSMRKYVTEYDDLHLAYAEAVVALTKQPVSGVGAWK